MQQSKRCRSESQAQVDSFHDCHVHGFSWNRDRRTLSLSLQYILEWVKPTSSSSAYRFSVCEAVLTFRSVIDLQVTMDWSGSALDAQIGAVRILGSRATPNGSIERHFQIEFADPDGTIALWSLGYELLLNGEPVLSDVTSIPLVDTDPPVKNFDE